MNSSTSERPFRPSTPLMKSFFGDLVRFTEAVQDSRDETGDDDVQASAEEQDILAHLPEHSFELALKASFNEASPANCNDSLSSLKVPPTRGWSGRKTQH